MLLIFLQLIYEFQQILGEPIRDKFEKKTGSPFVGNLALNNEASRRRLK